MWFDLECSNVFLLSVSTGYFVTSSSLDQNPNSFSPSNTFKYWEFEALTDWIVLISFSAFQDFKDLCYSKSWKPASSLPRTHELTRPMRQHHLSHGFIPPAHAPDSHPSLTWQDHFLTGKAPHFCCTAGWILPRRNINCLHRKCLTTTKKSFSTISFTPLGL